MLFVGKLLTVKIKKCLIYLLTPWKTQFIAYKQKSSKSKKKSTVCSIKKIGNKNQCHHRGFHVVLRYKEKAFTNSTILRNRSSVTIISENI